jgi:hypothetical protein
VDLLPVRRFYEDAIYEAAERTCADAVGTQNLVNKSTLKYRFSVSRCWPVLREITGSTSDYSMQIMIITSGGIPPSIFDLRG